MVKSKKIVSIDNSENISFISTKTPKKDQAKKFDRMAVSLLKNHKYKSLKKVISYLDKAIQLDPLYDSAFISRAIVYWKIKNYGLAFDNSNHAIKLNPNNAKAYFIRAHCNYKLGMKNQAIYDFKKVCELGGYNFKTLMKILEKRKLDS
jgi:Tfp pilus assembly protein PilF